MSISWGRRTRRPTACCASSWSSTARVVTRADPVVGYLHRGDEKIAENMTYNQFVPYTDRLDYLAPLANNMAYAIAVETPREAGGAAALPGDPGHHRRAGAHLVAPAWASGAFGIDVGAWTVFLYTFTEREKLYKLFEELTGARFTTSYTRIGGVARDVPDGWLGRVDAFCDQFLPDPRGGAEPAHAQQDLHRPHGGHRRHHQGGRHRLRPHRPQPARLRGAARPAQGPALQRLRAVRVRRARRHQGRLLRPLPRAGARRCASRCASSGRRSRSFPGATGTRRTRRKIFAPPKDKILTSHGGAHPELHAGHRGAADARRARCTSRPRIPRARSASTSSRRAAGCRGG